MLGFFRPKCPIDPDEKAWIELKMLDFADWLGLERLLEAPVVLPTDEFFPMPVGTNTEEVRPLFERVCELMRAPAGEMDFRVLAADDPRMDGAHGTYLPAAEGRRPIVSLSDGVLGDPASVIAVLAHEIAHHVLLGGGHHTVDDPEMEFVTDLLPTYLGLGFFAANSVLHERAETIQNWHHWEMRKLGYLPARYHGYAMALFCWIRGDDRPAWWNDLRLDVSERTRRGFKYLSKTNDSLFTRRDVGQHRSVPALLDDLGSRSPGRRIGAMWRIVEEPDVPDEAIERLRDGLADSSRILRREAAKALGEIGPRASTATDDLIHALGDPSESVRCAAAIAIGQVAADDATAAEAIEIQMGRDGIPFAIAAAEGLRPFGPAAFSAAPRLLRELRKQLVDLEIPKAHVLLGSLMEIVPDFDAWIDEQLEEEDPEIVERFREEIAFLREPESVAEESAS